jgi:hypothetical protein
MRDVAEAVRAEVRAAIDPVPLYPYRRIGATPQFHVRLYAGVEVPGRPAQPPGRDGVLYVDIFAKREEDVDDVYDKVDKVLHRRMSDGAGKVYAVTYGLESATKREEDDGTLHLACLYSTRYYRR